jgi:hypothetical protein
MSNLLILHVDGQNPAMVNTKIAGIYGCSFRLQMVSIGIDHYWSIAMSIPTLFLPVPKKWPSDPGQTSHGICCCCLPTCSDHLGTTVVTLRLMNHVDYMDLYNGSYGYTYIYIYTHNMIMWDLGINEHVWIITWIYDDLCIYENLWIIWSLILMLMMSNNIPSDLQSIPSISYLQLGLPSIIAIWLSTHG